METIDPAEIEEIKRLIAQAQDAGDQATSFSAERVKQCVAIGERLKAAKDKVGHGNWERFAEEHWPDVVKTTRARWMRLAEAKRTGSLDLDSARGLRHAYQLAGLLPDPGDGTNTKGSTQKGGWLVHVARLVAALQHIDIAQLKPVERATLLERLQPVTAFIGKVRDIP